MTTFGPKGIIFIKFTIMQLKLFSKSSTVLGCLLITCFSFGQKPFSEPIEGQVNSTFGGTIGKCKASSITFKYRLSTVSGEPAIYTNMKWENSYGTAIDCLGEGDFQIFIHAAVFGQYIDYWIPAQGSFGVMPKGDKKWGMNPLSGSPNWDELFLKNEPSNNSERNYLSADSAKAAWKSGYLRIKGILLLDKNGSKHNF